MSVQRSTTLRVRALDGRPCERMGFRDVQSVHGLGNPPGTATHRATTDFEVLPRNHSVSAFSLGPSAETSAITILPFLYFSCAQFDRKIATGGPASARNTMFLRALGEACRELYQRLQAGKLRAWYDTLPDSGDPELKEPMACREIVEDARLGRYLRKTVFAGTSVSPASSCAIEKRGTAAGWQTRRSWDRI